MTVVINGTTGIDTGTGSLIAADATTPTYLDLYEDTDNGSNYVRLIAPTSVAANRTITLPDGTGTVVVNNVSSALVSRTAITLTNQTAPEFTGIPSWAKRITVMFNGVSTNSTNPILVQIGDSGGIETTGYVSGNSAIGNQVVGSLTTTTVGFMGTSSFVAAQNLNGAIVLLNVSGNIWVAQGSLFLSATATYVVGGAKTLSDTLTQLRVIGSTTGSPTDTFDAGSINIIYE